MSIEYFTVCSFGHFPSPFGCNSIAHNLRFLPETSELVWTQDEMKCIWFAHTIILVEGL